MDLEEARSFLKETEKAEAAYNHASGLLYYDGVTQAPRGSAQNRSETMAFLSGESYKLSTSPALFEAVYTLADHLDALDPVEKRKVVLKKKSMEELKKIPQDEYVAYNRLLSDAEAAWHTAKEEDDYPLFAPYIEKIVATLNRFDRLIAPEKDPYNYQLDQFEEGLTQEKCDAFFKTLKSGIVPLIREIAGRPQIEDKLKGKSFPVSGQEILSEKLMAEMKIDRNHCTISTTEHPFTTGFTKYDVRITTHYHEKDPLSSLFSVVHEGGHALYMLGMGDDLVYTSLEDGASMGVHESQSRFYENILGRSMAFCSRIYPVLKELFPAQMQGITPEDVYRAANRVEPSLIRTDADELTYSLHNMVRFEVEKALFHGQVTVNDLPALWADLYREYLGVVPSCNREGCLQDSHWSGGAFGYFPSYALGSAYGAQLLHKMQTEFDPFAAVET